MREPSRNYDQAEKSKTARHFGFFGASIGRGTRSHNRLLLKCPRKTMHTKRYTAKNGAFVTDNVS